MNTCSICEEKFEKWMDYNLHKMRAECKVKVKPTRTNTWNKEAVVAYVENWMGKALIDGQKRKVVSYEQTFEDFVANGYRNIIKTASIS